MRSPGNCARLPLTASPRTGWEHTHHPTNERAEPDKRIDADVARHLRPDALSFGNRRSGASFCVTSAIPGPPPRDRKPAVSSSEAWVRNVDSVAAVRDRGLPQLA